MARYCGDRDSSGVLQAAVHWRKVALEMDGSVFSDAQLWSTPNLASLNTHFVEAVDDSDNSFFEKLKGQLHNTPPSAKQLAAEMLWLMFLCPSNITPHKKRENIELVWSWSGAAIPSSLWMDESLLRGIGSAGTSFSVNRWRELALLIRMMLAMKATPKADRDELLADGWRFAAWLDNIPESKNRQLRFMLLFLLFPDSFERIFSGGDRRLVIQNFLGISTNKVRQLSPLEIDKQLASLRALEQAKFPEQPLDFYESPLKELWQVEDFDAKTANVEREHVLAALAEIDQSGVPKTAESTVYDLIHGTRRYPPKLVLSLASKHAGGEAFDRSMFSGGAGSPAFALLRSLGFHIERKELITTLLTAFLAQAGEGTDLAVRGYPDAYRGMRLKVSFGKGNQAKVPWIAFLAEGQESQDGIYPVFLYYKADKVLILARGVSDTATPKLMWPVEMGAQTIDQFFQSKFRKDADRYGSSFVFRAYHLPEEEHVKLMAEDLDKLIAEYAQLMPITPTPQPISTYAPAEPGKPQLAAEPAPVHESTYTVTQAVEELFMDQVRFEDVKATWKHKTNLIVQGPPGVGKTFFFRRLAYALIGQEDARRVTTVQFHPTYAYEDFVQGYRPSQNGFQLKDGVFLRACRRAREDPGRPHVFVIDEINRGNLAKVFGELLMLLESDKRGPEWAIPLAYSESDQDTFFIPKNLYVLGLMNTADRSLSVVDYALRRRFAFASLEPAYSNPKFSEHLKEKGLSDELRGKIVQRMTALNQQIASDANLGVGFCIGHSFFSAPPENSTEHEEWYARVVGTEIAPLLREYFFDDLPKAESMLAPLRS